jgi:Na+-transporting NADH:ubiquinone oxidoreductase subunit A
MIKIKKGLDLPIEGSPEQKIHEGPKVSEVALIGDDLVGMKPTMQVNVGDKVKKGQLLYTDKKTEGIRYTSPASGEVIAINRGARRYFQSVVIRIEGDEHVNFEKYKGSDVSSYSAQDVRDLLNEAGLWVSFKTRPYSKAPALDSSPSSIFVTAIDTHPLAADPQVIIGDNSEAFVNGLKVLSKLAKVHLCTKKGADIAGENVEGVQRTDFDGPHPAGLPGTHIHHLDPVGEKKTVWHTPYQEVIAIGKLFETGKLYTEKVISVAGPKCRNPRLVRTIQGAKISTLVQDEKFDDTKIRNVSGSVFGGRTASEAYDYLGRFHYQVTMLEEGDKKEFLGWQSPGFDKFSVKPIYVSRFLSKKFNFTTNTNGSLRSIVPIGSYEKVMPLDIEPTFLLRSLMARNTEMSTKLGALELDEEDLSLCTFVDPCKNEFGPVLRENLTTIEKEG